MEVATSICTGILKFSLLYYAISVHIALSHNVIYLKYFIAIFYIYMVGLVFFIFTPIVTVLKNLSDMFCRTVENKGLGGYLGIL